MTKNLPEIAWERVRVIEMVPPNTAPVDHAIIVHSPAERSTGTCKYNSLVSSQTEEERTTITAAMKRKHISFSSYVKGKLVEDGII